MKRRLIAAACLLAFVLSGCAGRNRVPLADEREAWGYDYQAGDLLR